MWRRNKLSPSFYNFGPINQPQLIQKQTRPPFQKKITSTNPLPLAMPSLFYQNRRSWLKNQCKWLTEKYKRTGFPFKINTIIYTFTTANNQYHSSINTSLFLTFCYSINIHASYFPVLPKDFQVSAANMQFQLTTLFLAALMSSTYAPRVISHETTHDG